MDSPNLTSDFSYTNALFVLIVLGISAQGVLSFVKYNILRNIQAISSKAVAEIIADKDMVDSLSSRLKGLEKALQQLHDDVEHLRLRLDEILESK